MPPARQIVLVRLLEDEGDEVSASVLNSVPLGTSREVAERLAPLNIAPDGEQDTVGILFGPGLTVQLPMVGPDDPVMQAVVSIEEEIAWPVLERICKRLGWKMMDPNSGRMFG